MMLKASLALIFFSAIQCQDDQLLVQTADGPIRGGFRWGWSRDYPILAQLIWFSFTFLQRHRLVINKCDDSDDWKYLFQKDGDRHLVPLVPGRPVRGPPGGLPQVRGAAAGDALDWGEGRLGVGGHQVRPVRLPLRWESPGERRTGMRRIVFKFGFLKVGGSEDCLYLSVFTPANVTAGECIYFPRKWK